MSNFTGMDIPAVRQLANQMRAKADEIQSIQSQLTNQLNGTAWIGNDRERFVGDWQSQHVAALNNVMNAIRDAAQRADMNASEQEQASNAG